MEEKKPRTNFGVNCNPTKDKDISDWIEAQANYGASIKLLIRQSIKKVGTTDIMQVAYEKALDEPVRYIVKEESKQEVKQEKQPVKEELSKEEFEEDDDEMLGSFFAKP